MPIKSFAAPEEFLPAANAMLAFALGRPGQTFTRADFRKGNLFYGIAVGEFPYSDDFDNSILDNPVDAPDWLALQGLELLESGIIEQSRAESLDTAAEAFGLTVCVQEDSFDPSTPSFVPENLEDESLSM